MKRALLVTTSTVVGVAAVLAYQPNSEVAATMIDLTGAALTPPTTAAPTPEAVAPETVAPEATAAAITTTAPAPTAKPSATAKPTTAPTATKATPAPTKTTTAATPQSNSTRTLTGNAFDALHGFKSYGQVTVTVTLSGKQITDISFTQNPSARNEPYISAVRQYLIPAVLQAQTVNVGYVTGATATSEAFAQSLQSALDKG